MMDILAISNTQFVLYLLIIVILVYTHFLGLKYVLIKTEKLRGGWLEIFQIAGTALIVCESIIIAAGVLGITAAFLSVLLNSLPNFAEFFSKLLNI